MTDPLFDEDDEANTPLTEEERAQLIPAYITLRRELNEAEQVNITAALKWLSGRKRNPPIICHQHRTKRPAPRNVGPVFIGGTVDIAR